MHLLNLSISFLFRSGQGHDFSEDRTSYSYLTTFEIKLLSMFESKVIQYQVPYVISNPINFANTSNTSKYCSFLLKNITFVLILFAISLALSPVSFDLQFYCNTLALVQHMLYSTEYPLSDFLNFILIHQDLSFFLFFKFVGKSSSFHHSGRVTKSHKEGINYRS